MTSRTIVARQKGSVRAHLLATLNGARPPFGFLVSVAVFCLVSSLVWFGGNIFQAPTLRDVKELLAFITAMSLLGMIQHYIVFFPLWLCSLWVPQSYGSRPLVFITVGSMIVMIFGALADSISVPGLMFASDGPLSRKAIDFLGTSWKADTAGGVVAVTCYYWIVRTRLP